MADENNTSPAAGAAETSAPINADVKKKRAPRRQKQAAEPASAATEAVTEPAPASGAAKPVGRGRGRKPKSIEAKPSDGKGTLKGRGRNKIAKPAPQTAKASAPVIDELEDLIHLEEENKRLRKLLADKLRQENTDLRKRLGLD
ncbi:SyrB2 regulator [Rhizobium sp. NLR10a]|uniref:SyrB2 regulator n=1 Tax=unclassified Rhizobium TaxID=2613769 RepID=UPI001C83B15A|nr:MULTISPECIES: SyrB2 regulator [unclassified Rhizobium]MBX5213980.1 SyrB2 regulator [Rhizobium sp. NLR9a]MBX5218871.1 SyrB2 regulator [Rhizobium sp. NLR8a]MBX5275369.1 SyrB2 regulator [Rhizobium sp. NLR13a]MBX5281156.1 SyrB2 regulator [Rhizobium sp. NLR10a]MBX5297553.1 SyrB2 regulator [Rhizobium sp. NLR15a]